MNKLQLANIAKFFTKFPEMQLGNITLRDLKLDDNPNYFKLYSDPNVIAAQSDEDLATSIEESMDELKSHSRAFYYKRGVYWAIVKHDTDELIGTIGYNTWNFYNRRGEVCYNLMSDYTRQGIMTRALTNVLLLGFKQMNLYRIEARTMIDNYSSQELLKKMGFKLEGILRGYRVIKDKPCDITLYTLIPEDFAPLGIEV